jgi:putative glutamine amidotransferase
VTDRPLIGVTTSEVRLADEVEHTPQSEPPRREMALGLRYLQAIEAAGALPVVIPPIALGSIEPMLSKLSGLCLSGGPDLDPETYRARRHPKLGPTEPALDRIEIALAHRAFSSEVPVLGICRGAQALNVAAGGTLWQDLPGHRQTAPPGEGSHGVRVERDSLLAGLLGTTSCLVNSFHHQAARRVGRGLEAVAWAEDGVVEGLEAPGHRFAVGVQWHAELMTEHAEHAALFDALVAAARGEDVRRRDLRAA